jgi:Flp pilus assembly protein TadD
MRDSNLAAAIQYHQEGRLDEAERRYTQLYRENQRDAEVIYLLGVLCCDLGLFEPACRFLEEALALTQPFPEAQKQLRVARDGLAMLALLEDAESHNRLGLARLQQEKFTEAESFLRQALKLQPDHNQARNNLGSALVQQGQFIEAQDLFEAALQQDPGYSSARINLANVLRNRGDHLKSRALLETVLAAQPESVEALNNLGAVAQDLGDEELAMQSLSQALRLAPDSARIRWNLALSQLQSGDFPNGWRNFEARWEGCASLRGGYTMPPECAWRGESLRGKRLLLWAEQGFGDTLQFVRFARDVSSLGATVGIAVQAEVAALMRSVSGISSVTVLGAPLPAFDYHCPLMSLPYRLGVSLERAFHGAEPYLSAAPDKGAYWKERLADYPGRKVGLVWAGSSRQRVELAAIDARRSLRLRQLLPVLSIGGCSFFSAQVGAAAADIESEDWPEPVHDFTHEWTDFADTAAFIANLDLIISVDTAVAHLAGALGKPVWLLNRYDNCWRWLKGRSDSPWYASLRQFRQPAPGAWDPVIAAAAAELAASRWPLAAK